ncbi:hypothetical protein CL634_04155, partial [bacterium]|nr:hypothetical protein [bacterium]
EKCKICITNNIEIYLPECGHTCICEKCVNILNKNKNENIIEEEELLADIRERLKDREQKIGEQMYPARRGSK